MKIEIKNNAPVTLAFVLLSLISFVIGVLTHFKSTEFLFITYRSSFIDPLFYVRLVTYVFGHADWSHFISNMTYILLLSPLIEEKYGPKALIEMILITAVVGGIVNSLLFKYQGLCGASGIVFMLIVLSSITSVKNKEIPITLILVFVIFVGGEVYNALFVSDSISQLTHIIGGICGAIFGLEIYK